MNKHLRIILITAFAVTVVAVTLWQATGGDYYTKFQVVEEVEKAVDKSDPLAAAGFYEGDKVTETSVRDEFHFGLLPTPNGIVDKHLLSVISTVVPIWILTILAWWYARRKQRASSTAAIEAHSPR